ncbi:hypothetical protein HERIO_2009 [Hepatospora eriocheir]|uniref:Uncharacterized protein n=1 Tax=Hepatospora eriocheir TaxID=1081669 RepID=A0A1X0Q8A4_9MICR|nr:hypothetical protein HERIO_2009 [Hepatospora eriocheir]
MEITSNPVVYKIILGVSGLYMLALNRYFSKYYYKSNYYKLDITIKENKYKKTILLSLIMFIPIIMHKLASLTKDTLENQNSSYFLVLCFEFLFMLTFTDKPFKISKKTSFLSVIGILEIVKSFMFINNDESFIPLFNIFITTSICILLIVNCILNLAQYGNRNIEQTRFNENFRYINRNIIPLNYDTSLIEQVETISTL